MRFGIVAFVHKPKGVPAVPDPIVHDAEYYIVEAQVGDAWAREDADLDERLAELREEHGVAPNIIHVLWDDTAFGDIGIPALAAIRGFETPNIDRMRDEGIMFTRMVTEPACTPSRAAVITGRHPVRSGMGVVDWPLIFGGLSGEEVTTANVLSDTGYATAFYGKWHLGDIEESYPHKQGFDETLFEPYNQVSGMWNAQGDAMNVAIGIAPGVRPADPYEPDEHGLRPDGYVQVIEGQKDGFTREWGLPDLETYTALDPECEKRLIDFVQRNAADKKPFFASYWPNMLGFVPDPKKTTYNSGMLADKLKVVDEFIGKLMTELERLGIAENTLLVAMADNGPMVHMPPSGWGMSATIFRGGKGDFLEGGVRVPAFAWWPGTINPGQLVNDMIHESDLFTTFARLGGATDSIPRDRVIDGLDQTSLLLNGDTHGRRDYVFIYTGDTLGATVKGRYKRHWAAVEGGKTGTAAVFYDLILDPREDFAQMVPLIYQSGQWDRMLARHELWKEKYPDRPKARGIPFTGIENARQETKDIGERFKELQKHLPFDPLEFIKWNMPESLKLSQKTDTVD